MQKKITTELLQGELEEVSKKKRQLFEELYKAGPIQDLLIRKMRNHVEGVLREKSGADYAKDHYWFFCEKVITTALFVKKPDFFPVKFLDEKQIEKTKTDFPLPFQMATSMIDAIDNAKRYYEIELIIKN